MIGLNTFFMTKFSMKYPLTEEFGQQSFIYKVFYLTSACQIVQLKLMIALSFMESFCIASGLGYRAKSEKEEEEYNSIRVVKVGHYYTMRSTALGATYWNIQVHNWLKYYVMLRLINRGKRGLQFWPTLMTYLVSLF